MNLRPSTHLLPEGPKKGHRILGDVSTRAVVVRDTYMPLFTLSGGAGACSQKVVLRKRFRSLVDRFGPLYRPIALIFFWPMNNIMF